MSQIFTLKSRTSTLTIDFINPLRLEDGFEYGLSLLSFHSYNSIPNIEEGRNKFYYYENNDRNKKKNITIPTGAYEIVDIESYIQKQLSKSTTTTTAKTPTPTTSVKNIEEIFSLKPNNNTLQCEVYSSVCGIDFQPADSIGTILGFSQKVLDPKQTHTSDLPVNIVKVRTIHINSNITRGAFYHDRPSHTIYEFPIKVDPGYAIDETPRNLIYLPVNKQEIGNITLTVLDQNFDLVNFRGEEIIIRLELKKL